MIVLYLKSNDRFLQAITGFPQLKEKGSKLYTQSRGISKVVINDLDKAAYTEYPDQQVDIPLDDEGHELPITVEELKLRDFTQEEAEARQNLTRKLFLEFDNLKARVDQLERRNS